MSSVGVAVGLSVLAAPAQAITATVNVGGTNYDVTASSRTYNSNPGFFNTTNMPWWGNQTLATSFATALGGSPWGGLANNGSYGPLFAYSFTASPIASVSFSATFANSSLLTTGVNPAASFNYATATLTPTAVPLESDALPVVGSALFMAGAMGWKRKRQQAKVSELVNNINEK